MVRDEIIHHTVWRRRNAKIFYTVIGFLFAAAEMYISSLVYFIPGYRQACIYGIGTVYFVLFTFILLSRRNINNSNLVLICLLFAVCVCGIIASAVNGGGITHPLAYTMSLLLIPIFFSSFGSETPFPIIKGISLYCRIFLILYLLSVVLFKEHGLYQPGGRDAVRLYYLLGHVNASVKFALPALSTFTVADLWREDKIRPSTWVLILLTLAAQFYVKSYVAAFGMCAFVLTLFVFAKKRQLAARFPKWLPLAVSGGIFALIVVAQRSAFLSVVTFAGQFGRSGSISSRGLMWSKGLSLIEENKFGYGLFCDYSSLIRLNTYFPSSAHNLFLDVSIQTGMLGGVLFVLFLFLLMKNMPSWERWPVIPAALFSYAIMWNFEPYFADLHLHCTLLLLFLLLNLPNGNKTTLRERE